MVESKKAGKRLPEYPDTSPFEAATSKGFIMTVLQHHNQTTNNIVRVGCKLILDTVSDQFSGTSKVENNSEIAYDRCFVVIEHL